jgi:hypothetical protein
VVLLNLLVTPALYAFSSSGLRKVLPSSRSIQVFLPVKEPSRKKTELPSKTNISVTVYEVLNQISRGQPYTLWLSLS